MHIILHLEYMGIPFDVELQDSDLFYVDSVPKAILKVRKLIEILLKQKKETQE